MTTRDVTKIWLQSRGLGARRVYRAGTLRYTLGGVVAVFFWMLLGNFCLSLMEAVFPTVLPLTLKRLHASNATIGLLITTLPMAMNMIITPVVSYRSDRHRGRLGRRLPYLLWPTPFVTLFLIALGFSDQLGRWLYQAVVPLAASLSPTTVIFCTIGLCVVLFEFFNMFIMSVYYYLFNDVVPEELMGRFYGLFSVVGAGGGFVFNYFILQFAAIAAMQKWIYVGTGLVYLLGFGLMCWRVKEGEYPPPLEARAAEAPVFKRLSTAVRTYLFECFSLPYYWWFYLGTALYAMGLACLLGFRIFFAFHLALNLAEVGKVMAAVFVVRILFSWPLGWLSDKLHSIRLNLLAVAFTLVVMLMSGWFIHGRISFWVWTLVWALAWTAYTSSNNPLYPQLLPKRQFGQFASAASIFNALGMMAAGYGGGVFLDWVGRIRHADEYRAIYWWGAFFTALSLIFLWLVYRGWQRYGGRQHYAAPVRVPGVGVILEPHDGPGLEANSA